MSIQNVTQSSSRNHNSNHSSPHSPPVIITGFQYFRNQPITAKISHCRVNVINNSWKETHSTAGHCSKYTYKYNKQFKQTTKSIHTYANKSNNTRLVYNTPHTDWNLPHLNAIWPHFWYQMWGLLQSEGISIWNQYKCILSGEECFIENSKPVIMLSGYGLMPKTEPQMQIYVKQSIDEKYKLN